MKIAVIGAGIVGITTAYELAADGHQVTVIDKAPSAAVASSFALSGIISPALIPHLSHPASRSGSWFSGLVGANQFSLSKKTTWADMQWLRQWKSRRSTERAMQEMLSAHRLIEFSQQQLRATALATKIDFERTDGLVVLAHTTADMQALQTKADTLKKWGVSVRAVTPEEIAKIEPGLHAEESLLGGLFLPGDEAGNCRQFALLLKNELLLLGVDVRFDATVTAIEIGSKPHLRIQNQTELLEFDQVVMCSGVETHSLLAGKKIKLPMATVSSYSLTARIKEELNAPRSIVYNASNRTTVVRMGNRVRVAYGAELGTPTKKQDRKSVRHLFQTLQQQFPGAAEYSSGLQVWKGSFGVMPDGLPVVGQSASPNLWFNLGHGPNGWAMACGAARCVADAIGNRTPAIDMTPYNPLRF